MRHTITQEDEMGCGAACVAFAVRISYKSVAEILGEEKAKTSGFQLKELSETLVKYGLTYKFSHINRLSKKIAYAEGSLVFVGRSKRYPYGHYLIRHKNLWMDPWINLVINKDIACAKSGYRKRIPGKIQWVIYPDL